MPNTGAKRLKVNNTIAQSVQRLGYGLTATGIEARILTVAVYFLPPFVQNGSVATPAYSLMCANNRRFTPL
jgi:hypothetical protein